MAEQRLLEVKASGTEWGKHRENGKATQHQPSA